MLRLSLKLSREICKEFEEEQDSESEGLDDVV